MSCLNYDNPFASNDFSIFLYLTYPNTNDGDFFTAAHFLPIRQLYLFKN